MLNFAQRQLLLPFLGLGRNSQPAMKAVIIASIGEIKVSLKRKAWNFFKGISLVVDKLIHHGIVDSEFNLILYFFYGVVQVLGCLRSENFGYDGNVGKLAF